MKFKPIPETRKALVRLGYRKKSCDGKKRHANYLEAVARMRFMEREYNERGGQPLNVYYCRFCDGYHIGHLPKDRKVR